MSQAKTTTPRAPHGAEAVLADWRTDQEYQLRSQRTIDEREEFMRRYFTRTGIGPLDLTTAGIKKYVSSPSGKPVKPGTQWLYQQHFRAYCKWLVVTERRDDNPTERLPPISKPQGTPRPVSESELGRILSKADGPTRVMVLLGAFAGLRVHEIAKVDGRDYDPTTGKLHVIGKRRSDYFLDLHPVLRDAVSAYPPKGPWFPALDEEGKPTKAAITRQQAAAAIKGAIVRAGVNASAHMLRHRYGTELLNQTQNIRTVQELMRHSSISSTQIYTKVSSQARADAIASLPVPE